MIQIEDHKTKNEISQYHVDCRSFFFIDFWQSYNIKRMITCIKIRNKIAEINSPGIHYRDSKVISLRTINKLTDVESSFFTANSIL